MFSMRWSTITLIFRRELVDQLRDRRTLFMIFALPILLYPMLGMGMIKVALLYQQKPRIVVLIGADALPETPPLLNKEGNGFEPSLFEFMAEAGSYRVRTETRKSSLLEPKEREAAFQAHEVDVIVTIPPNIQDLIRDESKPFRPSLIYDSGEERSRNSARAIREVFTAWNDRIIQKRLERDAKPQSYLEAVQPQMEDVAAVKGSGTSVWPRIFPFLLVMMALTGAFYPAVDLCAGEKERGTMETLLISPASRPEIVMGKFLTVMMASIAMALLNLASMGLTAWAMGRWFGMGMGGEEASPITMPGVAALFWMIALLVPLSAFFSALSVALAAQARSMKEGQYYLTPLYVVVLPLIFVSLLPEIELSLQTSLVPVTGVALLLRTLMQGKYHDASRFFLPVLLPLLVYGALALRWAVAQFSREQVLFREAERFDLRAWLVHLVRDRQPRPSSGQALLCFALMMLAAMFTMGWMGTDWRGMVAGQVVFILLPPLLLTLFFTSSPVTTLRLRVPDVRYVLIGVGLALTLNPLTIELKDLVDWLFPIPHELQALLSKMLGPSPSVGTTLVVLALVPAICEEMAFRGFILSGLETEYRKGTAVLLSAFLFGFLHVLLSLFQQLFNATLLGIVLAMLAIRSRSLLPGILFHVTNNGLAVLMGTFAAGHDLGVASWLFRDVAHGRYHVLWVIAGALASLAMMVPLFRGPLASEKAGPAPSDPPPLLAGGMTSA